MEELREMVNEKTRLIFVTSPNNPTGAIFDESELQELCRIASEKGIYLLSDEVYRGLEWQEKLSPSAVNYYEKAISTASLSKTIGLQGIRTGWMATNDKALIEDCIALRAQTTEIMNVLGEYITLAALRPGKFEILIAESKRQGRLGWKIVSDWISNNPLFHWVEPKAGFLSFPRYDLKIGSEEFCKRLLWMPYRTYMRPGAVYGFENHLRLGIGGYREEQIRKSLAQVDKFISTELLAQ